MDHGVGLFVVVVFNTLALFLVGNCGINHARWKGLGTFMNCIQNIDWCVK